MKRFKTHVYIQTDYFRISDLDCFVNGLIKDGYEIVNVCSVTVGRNSEINHYIYTTKEE